MKAEEIIPKLKKTLQELGEVEAAAVFGSLVKGGPARDIDIAIKPSRPLSLIELGGIIARIAQALNVNEDKVDLIDMDSAPPPLAAKILSEGMRIKGDAQAINQALKANTLPDALKEIDKWINLNPQPKPDKAIIASRIEEIRRNTSFIQQEILTKKPDELTYKDTLALERALHKIAGAALDICRHLVSTYSLGLAESYSQYPAKLAEAGVIPRDLASQLQSLAGLRNILVHQYLKVKTQLLYDAAKNIAESLAARIIEWARNLLKTRSGRHEPA